MAVVEFVAGVVAEGPDPQAPTLTVGFETQSANLKFGVNVQGTDIGVFGDGGAGFDDPRDGPPGTGVFGIGNSFGVLGNGNRHNRDIGVEAIAGVFGESNHGSSGVIGVVMQGDQRRADQGCGVVGLSMESIGSELNYRPLPQATGKGIGVFGATSCFLAKRRQINDTAGRFSITETATQHARLRRVFLRLSEKAFSAPIPLIASGGHGRGGAPRDIAEKA